MEPKELANVLIKILGLSMCLYAVPSLVYGILISFLLTSPPPEAAGGHMAVLHQLLLFRIASSVFREGLQIGIGIFVIIRSHKIAKFLFRKDE